LTLRKKKGGGKKRSTLVKERWPNSPDLEKIGQQTKIGVRRWGKRVAEWRRALDRRKQRKDEDPVNNFLNLCNRI